jgi:hypothetical protein
LRLVCSGQASPAGLHDHATMALGAGLLPMIAPPNKAPPFVGAAGSSVYLRLLSCHQIPPALAAALLHCLHCCSVWKGVCVCICVCIYACLLPSAFCLLPSALSLLRSSCTVCSCSCSCSCSCTYIPEPPSEPPSAPACTLPISATLGEGGGGVPDSLCEICSAG